MSLDQPEKTKTNGSLHGVLLVVSLCVNLLLIGALGMGAARYFFWPAPPSEREAPRDQRLYYGIGRGFLNPGMMARTASAKSETIRQVIESHRPALMALRQESILARGAALRLYLADDFDKASFDKALDRVRAADTAFEAATMRVISDSAVQLSGEERRATAERWRKGRGHGMGGGGRGMGPGPGPRRRGFGGGEPGDE